MIVRYLYRSVIVSKYGLWSDYPSVCSAFGVHTSLFFQTSLTQKFKDSVSGGAINIISLCIGTRYPVIHCDRIGRNYGDAVRLTIPEKADDNIVLFFLSRHYGFSISEEGMAAAISLPHTFTECCSRHSHPACSKGQAWICVATHSFKSREEAVVALCTERNLYW